MACPRFASRLDDTVEAMLRDVRDISLDQQRLEEVAASRAVER